MNTFLQLIRDPETWVYLIALILGLVFLFVPLFKVCGLIFTLMGVTLIVLKYLKLRKADTIEFTENDTN